MGWEAVNMPTPEAYRKRAPPFTSYRLKHSMKEKILTRLKEGKTEPIKDWVAHRMVVKERKEVEQVYESLRSISKIGDFEVEVIDEDNMYLNPKTSGFKARELVVRVAGKGRETGPCVREIQIVDTAQNYINEFTAGACSHLDLVKRREHTPRERRALHAHYGQMLEEMFGSGELRIDVPSIR